MHRADNFNTGGVDRHKDLRLLTERFGIWRRLDHGNHDLAARITGTGDIVFLAVDDPFTVFQHGRGRDILGIRRRHIGFGHREGRPDFTGQQRLEPLFFLLWRPDPFQHFHVAGVGRGTVQRFRGQRAFAKLGRDIGVIEVRQTFTGFGIGQKEIPQPIFTGLFLGGFQQLQLAGRV